jgi:hypothetical protein
MSRLATDWTVRKSNPGGTRPVQTGCGAHSTPCILDARSLSCGQRDRGVDYSGPCSAEVKERVELSIPVLPVWDFTACSRAKIYIYVTFPVVTRELKTR